MNKMLCCRSFTFAAAHYLPDYPGKCKNLHGHTWTLEVCVEGRPDDTGMVIDFSILKTIAEVAVLQYFDHSELNTFVANPTAENLIQWIWNALTKYAPNTKFKRLKLYESTTSYVEFVGG